jgi:hypothetical protein
MNEELDTFLDVAQRLEGAGVPYMVTGSVAGTLYGHPKMTRDVDIVVALTIGDVDRFVALFREDCYIDATTARQETESVGMFNIIDNARAVKVDFILRKDTDYHKTAFGRRRRLVFNGTQLWIISPEDLVLAKLMWAKLSHSETQLNDARGVLSSVETDSAYMREWAATLGVQDLLVEIQHG